MEKYKKSLCALLVTTSVVGTSHIIFASTNKGNKINNVPQNKVEISNEVIIPEKTLLVKSDTNELESIVTRKAMYVKNVEAAKVEEAAKLAAKAEKARVAAEAEKAKIAAKAEKAKIAAAKVKKVAATTTKSTKKLVASRGTIVAPVSSEKAQEIIDYGKQFMGVKYIFGGASPNGFDCSGFTMYVFSKFGIDLPHSARSQAVLGAAVSKSDLIPGDLVFFQTYTSGISHVGIYIGNNNFLEASSSRGIAITSLSSSYYKTRYKGATRILK